MLMLLLVNGRWPGLLSGWPSLLLMLRLLLLYLCGAQAPSMQYPGIVRRVGLKIMRILLDLCSAIYIAYVSIVMPVDCCE